MKKTGKNQRSRSGRQQTQLLQNEKGKGCLRCIDSTMPRRDYLTIFEAFCKKERSICCACRRQKSKYELGLHHIVPTGYGGSNELNNLVLLCNKCHDIIEEDWMNYNTKGKISYSLSPMKEMNDIEENVVKPTNLKWQQWVYGGCKNPHL